MTGSVKINGRERIVQKFRKQSCYITQEFAMMQLLTTKETLMIAADLKLDCHVGKQKKNVMVSTVSVVCTLWDTQVIRIGQKISLNP